MSRRRQVRLSYPAVFVDLALYLAQRHGRIRAAKTLDLPLSTIYRWHGERRRVSARASSQPQPLSPDRMLAECEAHGFDLRARVRMLESLPAAAAAATPPPAARTVAPTRPERPASMPAPAFCADADAGQPRRDAAPGTVQARVQHARNEIDQRYYASLSCEHLAGLAGMSRFHFIRMFKHVYSVAPYHYLMQLRVHHARLLLGTTQQPLDTIAAAVGFDSSSSLSKAFKSVEGVSLSAFFRGVRLGAHPPQRRPIPAQSSAIA